MRIVRFWGPLEVWWLGLEWECRGVYGREMWREEIIRGEGGITRAVEKCGKEEGGLKVWQSTIFVQELMLIFWRA